MYMYIHVSQSVSQFVMSFKTELAHIFLSQLRFEDDLAITRMYSGEGEDVPLCETLYPTGNVED